MPGVDQIQPAVLRLLKLVVFEVRRHERVAARREDLVDRAAAAAAADGDTAHGLACVGEPEAGAAERLLDERRERPQRLCSCTVPVRTQAVGAALPRPCPMGCRTATSSRPSVRGQHVVDAAGAAVEIRMQVDRRDAALRSDAECSGRRRCRLLMAARRVENERMVRHDALRAARSLPRRSRPASGRARRGRYRPARQNARRADRRCPSRIFMDAGAKANRTL